MPPQGTCSGSSTQRCSDGSDAGRCRRAAGSLGKCRGIRRPGSCGKQRLRRLQRRSSCCCRSGQIACTSHTKQRTILMRCSIQLRMCDLPSELAPTSSLVAAHLLLPGWQR